MSFLAWPGPHKTEVSVSQVPESIAGFPALQQTVSQMAFNLAFKAM